MASSSRSGTAIAALVFALMVAGVAYRYWPGEERSIRRHLTGLAEALSFPGGENEVQRITRLKALQEYFVPDVRLTLDGQDIRSRDTLLDRLGRVEAPPGGIVVEMSELTVALAVDQDTATVTLRVRARRARGGNDPSTVDARHVVLKMTRQPGDWMIAAAEIRD
jgi:hypothetical protein